MTAPTETTAPEQAPEPATEPTPVVAPAEATEADRLVERASRAAAVRAHQTNPDVVALSVERVRNWIDLGMWVGMVIGMAFNTVNVQSWAGAGLNREADLMWWAGWALAPMAEIPLIAILLAEQTASRHGVDNLGDLYPWVRRARWTLLVGILLMATWSTVAGIFTTGGAGFDKLLQHGFPVIVVLACAEALSGLRAGLNRAVKLAAERAAAERAAEAQRAAEAAAALAAATAATTAAAPRRERRERPTPTPRRKPEPEQKPPANTGDPLKGRTAREFGVEVARGMWEPGTEGPAPIDIGAAMLAEGVLVSKSERSKIKTATYKQLLAEGFPALAPTKKTGDDADEPDIDESDTDESELTTAAEGGVR